MAYETTEPTDAVDAVFADANKSGTTISLAGQGRDGEHWWRRLLVPPCHHFMPRAMGGPEQ